VKALRLTFQFWL